MSACAHPDCDLDEDEIVGEPAIVAPRAGFDAASVARFWLKVDKVNGPVHPTLGRCWIWTAGGQRYGHYNVGRRPNRQHWQAHRYAYFLENGALTGVQVVRHRCDVTFCVRPDHLMTGTQIDNVADMVARGRQARGERRPNAKLTDADVMEIRSLEGTISRRALAERFGVTGFAVGAAARGVTWRHLPIAEECHAPAGEATTTT